MGRADTNGRSGFINRFGTLLPSSPKVTKNGPSGFFLPGLPVGAFKLAAAKRAAVAATSLPPFFYSFDYGMTHYVMFDTETDLGNGLIGPDETGGIGGSTEAQQGSCELARFCH